MKRTIPLIGLIVFLISCSNKAGHEGKTGSPIRGTWQLISVETIEGADTTLDLYTNGIKGIKMFNDTHFSFFQHDLTMGTDSTTALFVSGGGPYTLVDGQYKEHLEYCNFREYENHSFEFQVAVKGDTLIQRGKEEVKAAGVDKYIIETYLRIL